MGEVGVHRQHAVVAVLEAEGEAGHVGGPQPEFRGARHQFEPGIFEHLVAHQVPGPVGRGVVDDQYVRVGR